MKIFIDSCMIRYYRQDLIYPMDVFKEGPGRAVGQQGQQGGGLRRGGQCPSISYGHYV
jgi:hypothetical protein